MLPFDTVESDRKGLCFTWRVAKGRMRWFDGIVFGFLADISPICADNVLAVFDFSFHISFSSCGLSPHCSSDNSRTLCTPETPVCTLFVLLVFLTSFTILDL